MRQNGFALKWRTSLVLKLPSDYEEKLLQYQRFVIHLCKKYNYSLEHMGNADETPVFLIFYLRIFTVDQKGTKSVTVKITGNEKLRATVTVSYTHLDVYKRQMVNFWDFILNII